MSIMTTWEAVPSRLFSLYASLCDVPSGEVREKFEAQATPASLRNKSEEEEVVATNLFSNALREALAIGLVETSEDKLMITERARSFANADKNREQSFRRFMIDTLLDEDKARSTQQACFMATLAWFLTKSPFRPTGFKADPTRDIKEDLGDRVAKTDITAVSDYQNFLYWARYLGFATIVGGRDSEGGRDGRYVIPDPLEAIEQVLPIIFSGQGEVPIEQFMSRLAAIFPVFEGGSVRQDMIRGPDAARTGAAGTTLSKATSIALQRLEGLQVITLRTDADAPVVILDLGRSERRVSHVGRKAAQ
jgi:hypothetical protein